MKNGIYICATPIGNLGDVSSRAKEVLSVAEIIACEDTRVTKKLFSLLGLSLHKTFIPLHDHNEEEQAKKIIELASNQVVALVSDADQLDEGERAVPSIETPPSYRHGREGGHLRQKHNGSRSKT